MSRIVFECVDHEGNLFTMSIESENKAIEGVVAEFVQANLRCGIEVISASRIEEMPVDLNLRGSFVQKPATKVQSRWVRFMPLLGFRPARLLEKGALAGSLALGVIGFDNGFSIANLATHVEQLMPAMERMIHAFV
jgi:hypothetical protein